MSKNINNFFNNIHFKKIIRILKDYDLYGIQEKKSIQIFLRNNHFVKNIDNFMKTSTIVNLMHITMERSTNRKLLDLIWLYTYICKNKLYGQYQIQEIRNYIVHDCEWILNNYIGQYKNVDYVIKNLHDPFFLRNFIKMYKQYDK